MTLLDQWAKALLDGSIERGWAEVPAKPHTWQNISTKLSHCSSVAATSAKLLEFLRPQVEEDSKFVVFTAAFLHDIGKEEGYTGKAHEVEPYRRRQAYEQFIRSCCKKLQVEHKLLENLLGSYRIAVHGKPVSMAEALDKGMLHAHDPHLAAVLEAADGTVSAIENGELDTAVSYIRRLELDGAYVTFTRVRGFSTQLAQEAVLRAFETKGWDLLVYTPPSLFFCAQRGTPLPKQEEIRSELHRVVETLVQPEEAHRLVVGVYGQTPWVFVREILSHVRDHRAIWERVFSLGRGVAKRTIRKEHGRIPAVKQVHADFLLQISVPLVYLFRLPLAIAEELAASEKHTVKRIERELVTVMSKELHIENEKLIKRLSSFTWTAPVSKKLSIVEDFLEAIQKKHKEVRRSLEIKDFENVKNVLKVAFAKASRSVILVSGLKGDITRLADSLLEDVVVGGTGEIDRASVNEDLAHYSRKTGKGTPVCPICNGKASREAISSVIGGNTESFSNVLAAGTLIRPDNKVNCCNGCNFEGLLRKIYGVGHGDINFLVFPQSVGSVKLATYINDRLLDSPLELLQAFREAALPAELEVSGKTIASTLQDVFGPEADQGRQALEDWLVELLEPEEEFDFKKAQVLLQRDCDGEKLPQREAKIAARLKEKIKSRYFSFNPRYFPGFVLVRGVRVRSRDDNETEVSLKALTVAVALSRSLYGGVRAQLDISPIGELNIRGAAKAVMTSTLRTLGLPLEHDGWVSYGNARRLVTGLMAARQLANMGFKLRQGVDSILDVFSTHPTVLYNRLSRSRKLTPVTLLTLLEEVRRSKEVE